MAQRNSRNRIVAEPLFNYSQRRTASHQITASDPSTTGQTHLNYRTTGVHDPIPRPNEPEDMEIDAELPELEPMSDSDDEDDGVDEVPGIRVKKPRAKRYINTVCSLICHVVSGLIPLDRIRLWTLGLTFGTNTWTSSCALKVAPTLRRVIVRDVLLRIQAFDVKIVPRGRCGA